MITLYYQLIVVYNNILYLLYIYAVNKVDGIDANNITSV